MKNIPFLAIIASCTLFFVACKKDKSPEELLTGPSCWKTVKSETRASATDAWVEETIEACSKDDCSGFTSDGKTSFDEGATKCDPSDPQTSSGTYTLSEDGKILTVTQDGFTLPFTIEELTADKLVITVSFLGDTRTTLEAN